jgi:hypothetical protein
MQQLILNMNYYPDATFDRDRQRSLVLICAPGQSFKLRFLIKNCTKKIEIVL